MKHIFCASNGSSFHGWRIVCACMVLMFVSSGIGYHCNGVILDPLRNLHGWNKSIISSAITFYFIIVGLVGVVVGRKVDTLGARPILVLGAIINSLGLICLGFVSEVWQLFVCYGVMATGFTGTSIIAISAVITSWFIKRRGLALSIAMTGISIGGIVIVPAASYAISFWGIRTALVLMGISLSVVMIPVTLLFIKQRPSDVGQYPDGSPPSDIPTGNVDVARGDNHQSRSWSAGEVMRTPAFWAIVITFLLAMTSMIAVGIHQISFMSQFVGVTEAAFMVSVTTAASMAGRLLIGNIIDRYDKRTVVFYTMLFQATAILIMAFFHSRPVLYLCTACFGCTMGASFIIQSLLIGECFGMISFGSVFGLASLFIQCGAAFGPMIAGIIYDATLSYRNAFIVFAVASSLAAISVRFARRPGTSPA
jgi:MFS family permease